MSPENQFFDTAADRVSKGLHPETGEPFETGPKAESHALATWPPNIPDTANSAEARRRRQMVIDYFSAKKKPATGAK